MRVSDYLAKKIEAFWYQKPRWYHHCLSPLSGLYRLVMGLRFFCYRIGVFTRYKSSIPVIVVGNISVGGTGKTPLTIGLVEYLKEKGYRPGVVSRGYGGQEHDQAVLLDDKSQPCEFGDEPCMMYQRLQVPVFVCRHRVLAIQACEKAGCDIIISDDGLSHYAFDRDVEIVCVDGMRLFGSGYCLPVGPLREPKKRIKKASLCVYTKNEKGINEPFVVQIKPLCLVSVKDPSETRPLDFFKGVSVSAVAGIGHPDRFFALLKELGYTFQSRSFRDHHLYEENDFDFSSGEPIIMTEKDAIKCRSYMLENAWYVKVCADFDYSSVKKLLAG